jgi:hypothetical protein
MALLGRSFHQAVLGHEAPEDDPLKAAIHDGVRARAVWERSADGQRFSVHAVPHPDGGAVVTFDAVEA